MQKSSSRKAGLATKVRALADRAGTPGEQVAAEAALVRLEKPLEPPASQAANLDAKLMKRLQEPAQGTRITFDDQVAGFGIRITAAGTRSFVFNYRVKSTGQQRRVTI